MASPASPGSTDRAVEEGWKKQVTKVIAHVDLDAFYTQVEVKNNPKELRGKPVVVVQYNPYGDLATHTPDEPRIFNDSNGSLIAVSYEARKFGVKRNMRGDEARKHCQDLQMVQVPTAHGKADLTHYRSAGKQVTDILARLAVCEKASIDECYLDITAEAKRRMEAQYSLQPPVNPHQVHVTGQEESSTEAWYARPPESWADGERLLACGAAAVADLRAAVQSELGFSCSAGIAHCKILAKLASGLHKPCQQTVVTAAAVTGLLSDLPIPKLRQLGGKFGDDVMKQLNLQTVGELASIPKQRLESLFGTSGAQRLFDLAHGIDTDEARLTTSLPDKSAYGFTERIEPLQRVKQRTLPKSISCGKTFQGPNKLKTLPEVHKWLKELGRELEERVTVDRAENAREPKLLTVHAGWPNQISRSCALRRPTADVIAEDTLALLKKWASATPGWSIVGMSVCVSNFQAAPTGKSTLSRFFSSATAPKRQKIEANQVEMPSVIGADAEDTMHAGLPQDSGSRDPAGEEESKQSAEKIHSHKPKSSKTLFPSSREATGDERELYTREDHKGAQQGTETCGSDDMPSDGASNWRLQEPQVAEPEMTAAEPDVGMSSGNGEKSKEGSSTWQFAAEREAHASALKASESRHWHQREEESNPSDNARADESRPGDQSIDPEVLASLPPDIQRELKLASMMRLGGARNTQQPVRLKPQIPAAATAAASKRKKPSISNYFSKQ